MPVNQGLITFPSLNQIISGQFTLSHGIQPSIATLQVVPQAAIPAIDGVLSITYNTLQIDFPDCRIDSASLQRNQQGQVVSLRIMDRRWKWKFGEIIGSYNERDPEDEIIEGTEKTPQELATLLLQAMNEGSFDVSALPDAHRPTVLWDHANPAAELEALCSSLSCRVVLGTDNKVSIRRIGIGSLLPIENIQTQSFGINPPDGPTEIKVVLGPTIVQDRFQLAAVGEETDGTIKRVEDLSYTPDGGWEREYPYGFFNVTDPKNRKLALKSVFRWYQIIDFARSQSTLVENALPLKTELAKARESLAPSSKKAKKPFVTGIYWDGNAEHTNTADGTEVDVKFSLNGAEGIVQFDEPVYKLQDDDDHAYQFPDPITFELEVAFCPIDPDTRIQERHSITKSVNSNSNTGPQIEFANDITRKIIHEYDNQAQHTGTDDNVSEAETEAQERADQLAAEYEIVNSFEGKYAGIYEINPDGAIQQVSWSISQQGSFTQASINDEFDIVLPSFQRRKMNTEQEQHSKKIQSGQLQKEQEAWNAKKA